MRDSRKDLTPDLLFEITQHNYSSNTHPPKILCILGLGDIYDKKAILELKKDLLDLDVDQALADCESAIEQLRVIGVEPRPEEYSQIKGIHRQIWTLEASIRNHQNMELPMDEVGLRTLKIRDLNKQRHDLRVRINAMTGTGWFIP